MTNRQTMFHNRNLRILLGGALLSLACGCSGDAPEGTWATRLPEAEAWVAVKIEGGQAAAFICGDKQRLDISRWMTATADDSLTFELEGVTLSVDVNDTLVVGTLVDPNGVAVSLSAERIDGQGVAGLYTSEDSGARDGLILLPDAGDDIAELGIWRDAQGNLAQVTPVRPIALDPLLGLAATADTVIGLREFFMTEVAPDAVVQ